MIHLGRVKEEFSKRHRVEKKSLRFLFQGQLVEVFRTAEILQPEEIDRIYVCGLDGVHLEQIPES
jgi:hypothetical protein